MGADPWCGSIDFKPSGSFTFVRLMICFLRASMPAIRTFSWLLQIRPNYLHQFLGGLCLGRVLTSVRGEDVESDMPFHNFGHQTVKCATASSHELQDTSALLLGFQGSLDGVDLSPNASNTSQKL